jgi:plasmid maintenance system antidote protein VapI
MSEIKGILTCSCGYRELSEAPVHPGEQLALDMEDGDITEQVVCHFLECSPRHLKAVLEGEDLFSDQELMKLAAMQGTSVQYWFNLQDHFKRQCLCNEQKGA